MKRRHFLSVGLAAGLALCVMPALAGSLSTYDAGQFKQAVSAGPVVVHVHANWCPVCRKQQPILARLADEASMSGVTFITVNFDKDKSFLRTNRVSNQSVILVFKGGAEVGRLNGTTDADKIREGVMKALG